MAEPRRLRVDMHCHTRASKDSLNPYDRIVPTLDARGIDRVVITDHDRIEGALRLHARAPDRVIVGEEVRTKEGPDLIGIFLTELIPRYTPLREACERIRDQGGVVYVPHPFDTRRRGGGELLDGIAGLVDVVEAHNARTFKPEVNARGEAWARARGKLLGAGSDAHTLEEIGTAHVEMPPFEPNRDSFLAALADATIVAGTSSRAVTLWSTYASVRKKILP
ncbi:MAG TPA: PHP domain-containing protein [Longimicrobiaceae bacterium]|nr:PHP domain-containing protein [Longimicrobiaceae bacterium]